MKKFTTIFLFFWLILSNTCYVQADTTYITEFASLFYIHAIAVPVGASSGYAAEQLKDITATAYTSADETLELPIQWDFSQVNFHRTGVYSVNGHPVFSNTYKLSDNCSIPAYKTEISVQNCGSPDINAFSCMKAAGLIVFPWLPLSEENEIRIFLKRENSSWIDLIEAGYAFCDTDALYLSNSAMIPGNTYSLALLYKKQPNKIFKFRYGQDKSVQPQEYTTGSIENTVKPSTVIKSIEPIDIRTLQRYMAFAVPCGGNPEEVMQELNDSSESLLGSTARQYEDSAENPAHYLKLDWDYSEVNLCVPGVYKVTGRLSAPEGYTLDSELALPEYAAYISVQTLLQPEINTYFMPVRDFFCFPMYLEQLCFSGISEFEIWYRKDKESYLQLPDDAGYVFENGFMLKRSFLKEGSSYSFYISWEGGQTGTYSFKYDHTFITNDLWMGRNYADREQQTMPDLSQTETTESAVSSTTSSSMSSDNKKEKESVNEEITDKWTVISGRRLNVLMNDSPKQISFEKNGINAVFPAAVVEEWNIGENDTLQVYIQQNEERVSVHIYKNNQELTDIPGSYIQLEDDAQNIVSIAIDKTGEVTVDQVKKQKNNRSDIILLFLIIGIGTIVRVSSRKRGV